MGIAVGIHYIELLAEQEEGVACRMLVRSCLHGILARFGVGHSCHHMASVPEALESSMDITSKLQAA